MDQLLSYIKTLLFDHTTIEYLVISINILIFIFGGKVLKMLNHGEEVYKKKLKTLRMANLFLFSLFFLTNLIDTQLFQKIIMSVTSILGIYLFWEFGMFYIEKRYSKEADINGKTVRLETYQSDIFKGVATVFTVIFGVITVTNVWELQSLWQTGGIIASLLAFFAITHSSWLPDNIGGLITLHKGNVEAGDVIRFLLDGEEVLGYVGKITLTDVTVYDMVDKHKIYVRNSKFRDVTLHILSKSSSSSSEGILQYIDLNIGYSTKSSVVEMFSKEVFERACERSKAVNKEKGVRVEVVNNGDYAVMWRLFYYTNARNMKESEFAMNRAAKDVAEAFQGLSLDTPLLVDKV